MSGSCSRRPVTYANFTAASAPPDWEAFNRLSNGRQGGASKPQRPLTGPPTQDAMSNDRARGRPPVTQRRYDQTALSPIALSDPRSQGLYADAGFGGRKVVAGRGRSRGRSRRAGTGSGRRDVSISAGSRTMIPLNEAMSGGWQHMLGSLPGGLLTVTPTTLHRAGVRRRYRDRCPQIDTHSVRVTCAPLPCEDGSISAALVGREGV